MSYQLPIVFLIIHLKTGFMIGDSTGFALKYEVLWKNYTVISFILL